MTCFSYLFEPCGTELEGCAKPMLLSCPQNAKVEADLFNMPVFYIEACNPMFLQRSL